MSNDIRQIADLIDQRRTFVVAAVAQTQGSTPRKSGARMIVFPDGSIQGTIGGGAMEEHVKREAMQLFETGGSKLVTVNLLVGKEHSVGGICGGDVQLFLEKFEPAERLLIFGAGHCGRALAKMAQQLELPTIVQDDRSEFANPNFFPQDCRVVCAPLDRVLETVDPQPTDLVVVMTYAWPKDQLVLEQVLQRDTRFVGMIGSSYKCKKVITGLQENGLSEQRIGRVHAPIGLDIGAHTPAEVAVSILAQLVAMLNGRLNDGAGINQMKSNT